MRPDERFKNLSPVFWANVRTISQALGYTDRRSRQIREHSQEEIVNAYESLELSSKHLFDAVSSEPTVMGETLLKYFECRARLLAIAAKNLMDAPEAMQEFMKLEFDLSPTHPFAMNKQKGDKAGPALFTGIINMLLESKLGSRCDFDPRQLTTVTRDGLPVRTLARRVDGAFPSIVNPVAIWEIKEYYHTTTFGSRIADGVYETMLDGMELRDLRESEGIKVHHYLMVDSRRTWWEMGRSYLCRIVDMLHMGLVDEVLFGREVISRLPQLIDEWLELEDSEAAGTARNP